MTGARSIRTLSWTAHRRSMEVHMFSRRARVVVIGAGIGVAIVAATIVVVGGRNGARSNAASPPPTSARPATHTLSGSMRNKTFTIDERAYTTGRGDVSAVGMVDA